MATPIIVKCGCGAETAATAGDLVTCRCGRTYDTTAVSPEQVAAAETVRRRQKIYARLGLCVVGLATVIAFFLAGVWGAALALPVACLVWWKGVQPRWQRRAAADLAALPTSKIEARS
jgi:hypothetical protein